MFLSPSQERDNSLDVAEVGARLVLVESTNNYQCSPLGTKLRPDFASDVLIISQHKLCVYAYMHVWIDHDMNKIDQNEI